jgi:large subunit ribosomal protein L2
VVEIRKDDHVIRVVVTSRDIVSLISNVQKKESFATVKSIEYDPNRTAFIALLAYADGEKTYVIAQNGLVGQKLLSGPEPTESGNTLPLSRVPLGTVISCIELRPGQGSSYCFFWNICSINGKRWKYATIKMLQVKQD